MSAASFASYVYNKLSGSGTLGISSTSDMSNQSRNTSPNPKLTAIWRSKTLNNENLNNSTSSFKEDGSLLRLLRTKSMPSLVLEKGSPIKYPASIIVASSPTSRMDSSFNQSSASSPISPVTSRNVNPRRDLDTSDFLDSSTNTSIASPPPSPAEFSNLHGKLKRSASDGHIMKRRKHQLRENSRDFPSGGMPSVKSLRLKFDKEYNTDNQRPSGTTIKNAPEEAINKTTHGIPRREEDATEECEKATHKRRLVRHESLRRWEPRHSEHMPKATEINLPINSVQKLLQQFENGSQSNRNYEMSDESTQTRSRPLNRTTQLKTPPERKESQADVKTEKIVDEPAENSSQKPTAVRPRSKSEPNWNDSKKRSSLARIPSSVKALRLQFERQEASVETPPLNTKKRVEEKPQSMAVAATTVKGVHTKEAKVEEIKELKVKEEHETKKQTDKIGSEGTKFVNEEEVIQIHLKSNVPLDAKPIGYIDQVITSEGEERTLESDTIPSSPSVRNLRKQFERAASTQSSTSTGKRQVSLHRQETIPADYKFNIDVKLSVNSATSICLKEEEAEAKPRSSSIRNLLQQFEPQSLDHNLEDEVNDMFVLKTRDKADTVLVKAKAPKLTYAEPKTPTRGESMMSMMSKFQVRTESRDEDSEEEFYDESSITSFDVERSMDYDQRNVSIQNLKKPHQDRGFSRESSSSSDGSSSDEEQKLDRRENVTEIYNWRVDTLREQREEKERREREADELEKRKGEREAMEREKMENDRMEKEKMEQERKEREKAEEERIAWAMAEQERIALEKQEQEKIAWEKAEQERMALEKAELEKIAWEKAEQERMALEKAELEKIARKKAEHERLQKEKDEQVWLKTEQANRERMEREKAEEERKEREKAEEERKERDKLEEQQKEGERAEKEQRERENAEQERKERERLEQERIVKERAEQEQRERDKEHEQIRNEMELRNKERAEMERLEREQETAELQKEQKVGKLVNKFTTIQPPEDNVRLNSNSARSDVTRTGIEESEFKVGQLIEKFVKSKEDEDSDEERPDMWRDKFNEGRRDSDFALLIDKFTNVKRRNSSSSSHSSEGGSTDSSTKKGKETAPIPKVSTKNIPGNVRHLNDDELRFFNQGGAAMEPFVRSQSLRLKKNELPPLHPRGGSLRVKNYEPNPLADKLGAGSPKSIPKSCRQLRPDELRFFAMTNNNIYPVNKDNKKTSDSKQGFRLSSQGDQEKGKANSFPGDDQMHFKDYDTDSDSDSSLLRGYDQGEESSDEALMLPEEDFSLNITPYGDDSENEDDEAHCSSLTNMDSELKDDSIEVSNNDIQLKKLFAPIIQIEEKLQVEAPDASPVQPKTSTLIIAWTHEKEKVTSTSTPKVHFSAQMNVQTIVTDDNERESSDDEDTDNDIGLMEQAMLDIDEEFERSLKPSLSNLNQNPVHPEANQDKLISLEDDSRPAISFPENLQSILKNVSDLVTPVGHLEDDLQSILKNVSALVTPAEHLEDDDADIIRGDITDDAHSIEGEEEDFEGNTTKPIEEYYLHIDESKEYLSDREFAIFCFLVAGLSIAMYIIYEYFS